MPHLALQRMLLPGVDVKTMNSGRVKSGLGKDALAQGGMDALATAIVPSGGLAKIVFAGIPTGYQHLEIRWIGKDNRAATSDGVNMIFNGDTTSGNYYGHRIWGDGSNAYAQAFSGYSTGWINGSSSGDIFGSSIVTVLDYADTSKYKTSRIFGGNDINGAGEAGMYSMLWQSLSAINTIEIAPSNGSTFNQYSHFAIYGVK